MKDQSKTKQALIQELTSLREKITELEQSESERKRGEAALQESELWIKGIFNALEETVLVVTPDRRLININHATQKNFGYTQEELLNQSTEILHVDHEHYLEFGRRMQDAFDKGKAANFEFEARRKNGEIFPTEHTVSLLKNEKGKAKGIVSVVRDITVRKQAEEELRTSGLQLRALAARLQQIREEARIMIAREIHDELGGGLTGLKMDLSWLLHKVYDTEAGKERVAWMSRIHASNELIDRLIQVVRRIATDLRPSVLDDLGLIAALEWQLQEFTSRTGILHEFVTAFDYVNLEEATAIAVFRIFQETLTNVARHSGATKITVLLREEDGSLFLEIRDNGKGIMEGEIQDTKSLGILGMKERALVFGGDLRISGEPDSGTTLILKIPRREGETS